MTIEDNKKIVNELITELLSVPGEVRTKAINEELDKLCPDPSYSDYIFWSNEYEKPNGELDTYAIVEKIFSYKPIQL